MSAPPPDRPRTRRLEVRRRLEDGRTLSTGAIARDARGTWFGYSSDYLRTGHSLSPFALDFDAVPQLARDELPSRRDRLHGVFADALPDGWGLLLMDRAFRRHGIEPTDIGALDRLAFIGDRGIGALAFEPVRRPSGNDDETDVDLAALGGEAAHVFDGRASDARDLLEVLVRSGGSGGARPKALLWEDAEGRYATAPMPGSAPRLIKFTSASLPLGHDEGRCEAAWLAMAERAGIDVQRSTLLERKASNESRAWLSLERFDCVGPDGRRHLHSASGLLGADHRLPSLDYADLLRVGERLCRSPAAAIETFRRAMFNLLSANQDDHAKNWAWTMDDAGEWRSSPAFDLTFSPSPSGEHMTSYGGYGAAPPRESVLELARLANLGTSDVAAIVGAVAESLSRWPEIARGLDVSPAVIGRIGTRLERTRRENRTLPGL